MVEQGSRVRTFFRCIEALPITEREFQSDAAKGEELPPPRTSERARLFAGNSVYDSLARAMWRARKLDPPCAWIAELRMADDGPIAIAKTFKDPAPYTLWGEPRAIADCVVSIVDIAAGGEYEGA